MRRVRCGLSLVNTAFRGLEFRKKLDVPQTAAEPLGFIGLRPFRRMVVSLD